MDGAWALCGMIWWCPCTSDLVHVANVLYLGSYLVRDILWLRVLTVLAGLSLLPFYGSCSEHILWAPILWNIVFMTVNVVQIGVLLRERRPQRFGAGEQELYTTVFADLNPGEFRRLLRLGAWKDVAAGSTLVHRDTVVEDMMVLHSGAMDVRVDDEVIAHLEPKQFIGEMSFLTGHKATADVVATEPCRVLAWSQASLGEALHKKPGLAFKIRGILGQDVVAKLRAHGMPRG